MAVERNAYGITIDELINALVIREIPSHHQPVDKGQVRQLPGQVDLPAIHGSDFYDPVRVFGGSGSGGRLRSMTIREIPVSSVASTDRSKSKSVRVEGSQYHEISFSERANRPATSAGISTPP